MITVLTPTYNRADKLRKLYDSLCNQKDNNFKWLIVDDGSIDNTECVIRSFTNEKKIDIKYIKKDNGGKHSALNVGLKYIDTELTFIVDSDDYLPCEAIQIIDKYADKYRRQKDIKKLCGFSFLRMYENGTINGKNYQEEDFIGNHITVRVNGRDDSSDKAEVFYTSILKMYPFPEFDGEKFLGEDVVWMRIARSYQMVFINKAIYIAEYLNDGLTHNRRRNNIKSPNGCVLRAEEYMHHDVNLRLREKSALQYLIYGWFANRTTKDLISKTNYKIITLANILPAKIIYKKWKKEFEESN